MEFIRLFVTIFLMFSMSILNAAPRYSETKIINYAKSLDVARLDPKLQSQSLDGWLRHGPAKIQELEWKIANCCNCDRNDGRLCVKFIFQRAIGIDGYGMLIVGDTFHGIRGEPVLESLATEIYEPGNLSELPKFFELQEET